MVDLYSTSCYNNNATLAHCNGLSQGWDPDPFTRWSVEESDLIYLDGWHAMRFGWIRPEVFFLRNGPGFANLSPLQIPSSNDRAVIIYDGSVGTEQYDLMEYRTSEFSGGEQIWSDQDEAAYRRSDISGDYPSAGYDSKVAEPAISDRFGWRGISPYRNSPTRRLWVQRWTSMATVFRRSRSGLREGTRE